MLVSGPLGWNFLLIFWRLKTFRASFVTPPIQPMFSRGVRQAHSLKVAGSNPAPATNTIENTHAAIRLDGGFFVWNYCRYVKMRNARRRHSLHSAWFTLIYWDLA